jgi:hypothetical protein
MFAFAKCAAICAPIVPAPSTAAFSILNIKPAAFLGQGILTKSTHDTE